jgi:deoxyribodipyrimidine photolyase-related protein
MNTLILFPNQIFELEYISPIIETYSINKITLLEHPIFFGLDPKRKINFNKMKLVLHRACLYYYLDYLKNIKKNQIQLEYIKVGDFKTLNLKSATKVYYIDVPDHLLDTRMKELRSDVEIIYDYFPNFILSRQDIDDYFEDMSSKKKKGYFHKQFYEWTRKELNILMSEEGKPLGGTFSYDKYNRSSPPKDITNIPKLPNLSQNDLEYIAKAKKEIDKEFNSNYGNSELYVPVTFEGSKIWFDDFIEKRLGNFGKYQDAVVKTNSFMYHSIISPMLNCGLLSPNYVIDKVIEKLNGVITKSNMKMLYSVEGFVRQVLGWREWQRVIYIKNYESSISSNYYDSGRRLSSHWYNGTLGVEPIDDTIKSAYKNAYLHHILRLMYMSNFMTLCRIHPDEMYYWFMSFSMDSYDWVMIQNVYGMGSFADGGNTTTKPYITTGNYIMKMSDYSKGPWVKLWEALYYIFIRDNLEKLVKFPRVGGIMRRNLERKSEDKMEEYQELVDEFFKRTE